MSNVPIISSLVDSEEIKSFREKKFYLRSKSYPKEETYNFVKDFYLRHRNKFIKKIEPYSFLFIVPSTSKRNDIPYHFAKFIQKEFIGINILNSYGSFAQCTHLKEAKYNWNLTNRLDDPINFKLFRVDELKNLSNIKPVYLIDDISTTGETLVNLKKRLNENDIKVDGFINLLSSDRSYVSKRDIERLYEKILPVVPEDKISQFKLDINEYLDGYLKKKCSRLEIGTKDSNQKKLESYETITKGAAVSRRLKVFSRDVHEARQIQFHPGRKI